MGPENIFLVRGVPRRYKSLGIVSKAPPQLRRTFFSALLLSRPELAAAFKSSASKSRLCRFVAGLLLGLVFDVFVLELVFVLFAARSLTSCSGFSFAGLSAFSFGFLEGGMSPFGIGFVFGTSKGSVNVEERDIFFAIGATASSSVFLSGNFVSYEAFRF